MMLGSVISVVTPNVPPHSGLSYIAQGLAKYLDDRGMTHTLG